jgi:hypothetical protein
MTPVLQALVAVAVGVLLGMFLLSQVALIICGNSSHMRDVVLVVFRRLLLWIFLQDLDNLTSTMHRSAHPQVEEGEIHLSWPMLSPEPSLFDQPESLEDEPFNHLSNSSAVMLTVLLKSLP